ncbi:arsenic transporter [Kyrpidia tusciae]|uniref:Arsenical pump membrane protein n=1 Tax=Kyrpidia tusciae (strain DSM 2912 / NBRC 15312 / T2) TaxID=562970 RepID=D5WWH1_KYRT2|nr:arsenic transporter [Kyrpidia tusciae]ADG07736.1 Arsenical pump membrane protein [Kyrpidia tusciae DSM 2912]
MLDMTVVFILMIFFLTVLFIMWRPYGINEAIPTTVGAACIFLLGVVPLTDIYRILGIVNGASITILSTIVMSIVLQSIGFFRWVALNLVERARGSGILLYWYVNLLCFLMTMFFNNDGSILITTPIIMQMMTLLHLKREQKMPYLLSGALVATAASAPIGVSNLANLIALNIVGLDLNTYAAMMFVPSMIGIAVISLLLYLYFRKEIPNKISIAPEPPLPPPPPRKAKHHHPVRHPDPPHQLRLRTGEPVDWWMFRICIAIVIFVRAGFFLFSGLGIPIEWIAVVGAWLLIAVRWYRNKMGALDIIKKTPWHILVFAFTMYVIVYGLHNSGLTMIIVEHLRGLVTTNHLSASLVMGAFLTLLSNMCNNLPSVMVGTLALKQMGLDTHTLQIAYLASIIGSDVGALITPMGTLATLIWMFILRKNGVGVSWSEYLKISSISIPTGLIISLLSLYGWTEWLFFRAN